MGSGTVSSDRCREENRVVGMFVQVTADRRNAVGLWLHGYAVSRGVQWAVSAGKSREQSWAVTVGEADSHSFMNPAAVPVRS